jgi:hypothetical protein
MPLTVAGGAFVIAKSLCSTKWPTGWLLKWPPISPISIGGQASKEEEEEEEEGTELDLSEEAINLALFTAAVEIAASVGAANILQL